MWNGSILQALPESLNFWWKLEANEPVRMKKHIVWYMHVDFVQLRRSTQYKFFTGSRMLLIRSQLNIGHTKGAVPSVPAGLTLAGSVDAWSMERTTWITLTYVTGTAFPLVVTDASLISTVAMDTSYSAQLYTQVESLVHWTIHSISHFGCSCYSNLPRGCEISKKPEFTRCLHMTSLNKLTKVLHGPEGLW